MLPNHGLLAQGVVVEAEVMVPVEHGALPAAQLPCWHVSGFRQTVNFLRAERGLSSFSVLYHT